MRTMTRAWILLALLFGAAAWAEDESVYSEGPVIQVTDVKTKYGMFDEYMKFLDGPYKKLLEEQKKAGLIMDYGVYQAFPHNPHEPDLILTVTYKNWSAFDGLREKVEAITSKVYGSLDASNKAAVDREKIRDVLGGQAIQKLNLK